MKTILMFLILGSLTQINVNDVNIDKDFVIHRKIHLSGPGELNNVVISIPEEGVFDTIFACTPEVKGIANKILEDRPNGSEVFAIFQSGVITDMAICHEHDGVVIECGDPL